MAQVGFLRKMVLVAFLVAISLVPVSQAVANGQEHRFRGAPDGQFPQGSLVTDGAGNFYGTTLNGGAKSIGAVFRWFLGQGGQWTESVIYSFTNGADGEYPGVLMVIDASGNLYGTAYGGLRPYGTVFRLTPNGDGSWSESTLYNFQDGSDGGFPGWGLTADAAGNLIRHDGGRRLLRRDLRRHRVQTGAERERAMGFQHSVCLSRR